MSAIAAILLEAAAGLAVPIVKKILGEKLGGAGGKVAGELIDVIADKIGVTPAEIPNIARTDPDRVEAAIVAAEPVAAELVLAYVESQRLANELMLAEMDKSEHWFGWAWRPAWMWFLGFLWFWRLVAVPIADAAAGSQIAATTDMQVMAWLTTLISGLYMGGHTALKGIEKWKGR
jgi:hypothetical protein